MLSSNNAATETKTLFGTEKTHLACVYNFDDPLQHVGLDPVNLLCHRDDIPQRRRHSEQLLTSTYFKG